MVGFPRITLVSITMMTKRHVKYFYTISASRLAMADLFRPGKGKPIGSVTIDRPSRSLSDKRRKCCEVNQTPVETPYDPGLISPSLSRLLFP
jgi:hypothetical protein